MNDIWISALIGGSVAVILAWLVSRRAGLKGGDGSLRVSGILRMIGWIFAAASLALAGATISLGPYPHFVFMLAFFGATAVALLAEAYVTKGRFDAEGIEFQTPWTGKKSQRWSDLSSVRFSPSMQWYVLTFKDGTRIRLSTFVNGHARVIALIDERELERLAKL